MCRDDGHTVVVCACVMTRGKAHLFGPDFTSVITNQLKCFGLCSPAQITLVELIKTRKSLRMSGNISVRLW